MLTGDLHFNKSHFQWLDEFAEYGWLSSNKNDKVCSDRQTRIFSGINFGCLPYFAAFCEDFIDCNILLKHIPPKNTATTQKEVSGSRDWGDEDIYRALKEGVISPEYLLCGHVENPIAEKEKFHNTEIINSGADHNASVPNYEIIAVKP